MATGLSVAKTLIKYNNNSLEENDEETIDIEFTEQNADLENVIDFRWSSVQEEDEEDIALANFIDSLHKQTDE